MYAMKEKPMCENCIDFIRFRPKVSAFAGVSIEPDKGYGVCKLMIEQGEMAVRAKPQLGTYSCPSHREMRGDYQWSADLT